MKELHFLGMLAFVFTLLFSAPSTLSAQTGCIDPWACNFDGIAVSDDGSCEYLSCTGCTIDWACNYDASASLDDGSCDFSCLMGCTYDFVAGVCNSGASNYDPTASIDDGTCIFQLAPNCPTDFNCDGITDTSDLLDLIATHGTACSSLLDQGNNLAAQPVEDDSDKKVSQNSGGGGCTHTGACNYNPDAPEDDGSCEFTSCAGCTYATACNYDPDVWIESGSCDFDTCSGCTYADSDNYDPTALIDDGSCAFTLALQCPTDLNGDGFIGSDDLLIVLGQMGLLCNL